MSLSPEMRHVTMAAAGVATFVLAVSYIRQLAKPSVKQSLIDDLEHIGKLVEFESEKESTTPNQAQEDEFVYDFITVGGGTLAGLQLILYWA